MLEGDVHAAQTTFLLLLLIVVVFGAVAHRIRVPDAIVLVVAGLLLSFVPHVPAVPLNPDVIFTIFLPLLLYWAAWHSSWRTLRRNGWSILVLAVGLVIFTVAGVTTIAPLFVPGLDWHTAFILGAMIAPTDAIAATAIGRRLGLPRRIIDILEGESLINDATGLLAFRMSLVALLAGTTPTLFGGISQFAYVTAVGLAVGVVIGQLVAKFEEAVDEPPVIIGMTVLVPYAAYLAAESIHASGVIAVVTCGLLHSRMSDVARSARARLDAEVVWNTLAFVLNGLVFALVGLQLRTVLHSVGDAHLPMLLVAVAGFALLVVALRFAWVFPAMMAERVVARRWSHARRPTSVRSIFVIAWSSMRGVIALAAAMSLPVTLPDGRPFTQRGIIIFLTFGTVVASLVLKTATLPLLVRRLGLGGATEPSDEEYEARGAMIRAALDYLESARARGELLPEQFADLRRYYTRRLEALGNDVVDEHGTGIEHAVRFVEASHAALSAERETALELSRQHRISDEVLRELLVELDVAEVRLSVQRAKLESA